MYAPTCTDNVTPDPDFEAIAVSGLQHANPAEYASRLRAMLDVLPPA